LPTEEIQFLMLYIVEVKTVLQQVSRELSAAIARDNIVSAAAVFSVLQVETEEEEEEEPLIPNVVMPPPPLNAVANANVVLLRIDVQAAQRMVEALKSIAGIDYKGIMKWVDWERATTNSAFLDSEQKRADFGEMMFEFGRARFVVDLFDALVVELESRRRSNDVCGGACSATDASMSKGGQPP